MLYMFGLTLFHCADFVGCATIQTWIIFSFATFRNLWVWIIATEKATDTRSKKPGPNQDKQSRPLHQSSDEVVFVVILSGRPLDEVVPQTFRRRGGHRSTGRCPPSHATVERDSSRSSPSDGSIMTPCSPPSAMASSIFCTI